MHNIAELKKKHRQELSEAVEAAANDVLSRSDIVGLYDEIATKLESGEDAFLTFDDYGMLENVVSFDLPDSIMELDEDVRDKVISTLVDDYYFELSGNELNVMQCLGEPVIFNVRPYRNHYAIYSTELGIKIESVINETHGWALIERAQRKAGYFGDIVETNYYGQPSRLIVPDDIRNLTDEELVALINKIENSEDE